MRIKGASAIKSSSNIFHPQYPVAWSRTNSNPSLAAYLLEQQKRRLIKERRNLELKNIANKQGLLAVFSKLDQLTLNELSRLKKLESSLSSRSKVRNELKEEKKMDGIRFDY